jgi:hypothetical protein
LQLSADPGSSFARSSSANRTPRWLMRSSFRSFAHHPCDI